MRKRFTHSTMILVLAIIPALLLGNQIDAGDPVLRNMNKYLMAAQKNKKDGLALIANIAKMVKQINLDIQRLTSPSRYKSLCVFKQGHCEVRLAQLVKAVIHHVDHLRMVQCGKHLKLICQNESHIGA